MLSSAGSHSFPLARSGGPEYDADSKSVSVSCRTRLNPVTIRFSVTVSVKIAEFWHLLRARLALLTGRRDCARVALKNALRSNPSGFSARFLLGRLYLREGAIFKMKREFDLAWQVDPERFERSYARLRSQGEGAPDLFSFQGEGDDGVRVSAKVRQRSRHGDFRDGEERRRLEHLPPISREEISHIDWDRFQDEIHRDTELR